MMKHHCTCTQNNVVTWDLTTFVTVYLIKCTTKEKHNNMWGNAHVSYKAPINGAVETSEEGRNGRREEREEK